MDGALRDCGIGLRRDHYGAVLSERPEIPWFEVTSENFMAPGGRPRHILERVRSCYPVANLAASKVNATIQAASIDTNVEARDKDLRSKRFFDVEAYPTLTFASSAVIDTKGNKGKVRGR